MKKLFFTLAIIIIYSSAYGQVEGNLNAPTVSAKMPEWAKLMYETPINFIALDDAYKQYYLTHPFEKNHFTRYYKRLIMTNRMFMSADGKAESRQNFNRENSRNSQQKQTYRSPTDLWKPYQMQTFWLEKNQESCPWQTNVYAIDLCKAHPEFLMVATETGGLFRSLNKGISWQQIGLDYQLGSEAIAIHPLSMDTIYIGNSGVIRRSTDGGLKWTTVLTVADLWVYDLEIPVSRPHVILAATSKGLYRSENSGKDWTRIFQEASCEIKSHPTKNNIIYALRYNGTKSSYDPYKSTNYGANFTLKNSGWHNLKDGGVRMATTAADPKRVYAIVLTSDKGPYLMRSNDEGESWLNTAKGSYDGYDSPNFPMDNWQGFYDLSLVASQTKADEIITGTGSTFKSTDGGTTFKVIGGYGGAFALHPDLQASVSHGNDCWIATDGGLTHSSDFFTMVQNAKALNLGLNGSDFWGFDAGWHEKVFVGGRYHNGNTFYHENYEGKFIRMGGAESPTGYLNPIKNKDCYFSDIGAYTMPAALDTNWKWFGLPCEKYPNESYYPMEHSDMVWSPLCYQTVYLGQKNTLWKSVNNAVSFSPVFSVPRSDSWVEAIEISRSNPEVMYFTERSNSASDGKIWKSINGGLSFSELPPPAGTSGGERRVKAICLSDQDDQLIFQALRTGGNNNKVFVSKDGGMTWINLTTSKISNQRISDICFQNGTDGGVYIACDGGRTFYRNLKMSDWEEHGMGLSVDHFTRNLRPFYRDGKLINGSSMGVWEINFFEESKPVAQPSVDKQISFCDRDTFYFEDYSVLKLDSSVAYFWEFPGAVYISDATNKSPKVVFGKPGKYTVKLTVKNNAGSHTNTVNDMVEIKTSTCSRDTIPGKMLDLSAKNNYASIPAIPALAEANGFTCMAWIKINKPQDCFTQILSNWDSNIGFGFGFAFQGYRTTTNLTFFWKGQPYQLTSSFNLDTTKWIHVAMVVYPDSVRLYKDGQSWTRRGDFSGFDLSKTPWTVGQGVPGQCGDFDGQMDELKIFNRSLTEEEIRLNMHLISTQTESGLVAYYQFNEAGEQIFYDKVNVAHALNGNGILQASTAPVSTGISEKMMNLDKGKNTFQQTGVEIHLQDKPSGQHEVAAYRLFQRPDSMPSSGMEKYADHYFIIRTWGNISSSKFDSIGFSELTRFGMKEVNNPSSFKLFKRIASNEHLSVWSVAVNASSAFKEDAKIFFPGSTNFNGQYIIQIPEIDLTNVFDGKITSKKITLLPNPGSLHCEIQYEATAKDARLLLINAEGKILLNTQWVNHIPFDLDLTNFVPGIYLVKIENANAILVKEK
ncbi:MAG: PKD domain-containing protein [Saprospiraceae bacterium]|nr:PKD domain-containing protein [Candidatus Vicinibacter affinis]MBP6173282.1 PKD domain-containing protein [Saprospiraceae bacterium]